MIKVSFKEDYKTVQRYNDKCTIVTLKGEVKAPSVHMPFAMYKWLTTHPIYDTAQPGWGLDGIPIKAVGKTIRTDNDEDNPILAERIAESKAKIKIYSFMYTLTKKIYDYYIKIALGYKNYYLLTPSEDCLFLEHLRYRKLCILEQHHLDDLIAQS